MPTVSPVLFIVFNRPDVTERVFQAIKEARPSKLYVAADGPRKNRPGEEELCARARHVASQVDWPCEVHTKFNDQNLGCKEGVVSAINWFFENEQEGIILEDDCLPTPDFFRFCDTLLERYRYDTRVRHIGGTNYQRQLIRGESTYYFSRLTHIWGWATWRRVWATYDKNLQNTTPDEVSNAVFDLFDDAAIADFWKNKTLDLKHNRIDTWDYQLQIAAFLSNAVGAIPNTNLISNIGFGEAATHTHNSNDRNANLPTGQLHHDLIHPRHYLPCKEADLFSLNTDVSIAQAKRRYNKLVRRIKRFFAR
jgi:hypothetical protein